MKNVYTIQYEQKMRTRGVQKRGTWVNGSETLTVVANGDIRKAVDKARRHLIGEQLKWRDEHGKKRVDEVVDVHITSVHLDASVDVM